MSRVIKSAVLLAASLAPLQAEAQSYYCEAQGVYTVCVTERGYEQCQDRASMGGAAGADRAGTQQNAIIDCTSNQMSGVQRGNFPTGSSTTTSRAFSKTPCQVTSCKEYSGSPPAASGGGAVSDFDRLMAEGEQFLAAGDQNSAVARWQQASQLQPNHEMPYLRVELVLLRAGRYADACSVLDQGLQNAGTTVLLRLASTECAIYRGQLEQAEQVAISLMQSETNADVVLAANLVGWMASSLRAGQLVPCSGLASTLAQRSSTPAWDLGPMLAFLVNAQTGASSQVAALVSRLQAAGVGSASDFQSACGE